MNTPLDLWRLDPPPCGILAVKLSSFGDIVHSTPSLHALAAAFPGARLFLAVETRWRDVVRYDPHLTGLVEASSRTTLTPAYLWEVARALSAARAQADFDLAIDLQGTRRSAACVYFSKARIRTGRGLVRPGWHGASIPDLRRHAVRVCADICENAGVPVSRLEPRIYTGVDEEAQVDALLDAARLPRTGFALLNPFSRWASKSWSIESAARLALRLRSECSLPLIVTGGPEDRAKAAELVLRAHGAGAVSLAGQLSVAQALCLYRRGRLMISCDSGPMHAAAALDVPVLALFGPTHPERTGPWGPRHRVLQASRPSEHNAYRRDPHGQFMAALTVDRVFDAVIEMLAVAGDHAPI